MNTYPVIISVETSPKKGVTETATFGIVQDRPYPTLGGHTPIGWQNDDNVLFRSYGNPPKGLPNTYRACLLKPGGIDADTRQSHAGYEGNPGTISYRGKSLGELSAAIDFRKHQGKAWVTWRSPGRDARPGSWYDRMVPSETKYLDENVAPAILKAIEAHAETLRAHAIEGLRAKIAERIAQARADIDDAEKQALEALATVENDDEAKAFFEAWPTAVVDE